MQLVIPPDGRLAVPLLEPFSILGKTTAEVAMILTEKWKKYVKNPSVSVALILKRKDNVLVYGFVVRPGTVEYKPPMRLMEAVGSAGGQLPMADMEHVTITHKNGDRQTLDLSHPENRSGSAVDIMMMPGDTVYLPERHAQVTIVGEVLHPGSVDFRDDMTVEDVVTAGGGLTDKPDLANSTLTHRDGTEIKLDLDALYHRGDTHYNFKMAVGDRILIPETKTRIYVFGAVVRPGFYAYKPGERVLDALNAVGGPLPQANLATTNLLHIAKDKQSARAIPVNLYKLLKKGDYANNLPLQEGDVLVVPLKDAKESWTQSIWGILSGFNIVYGAANLMR
jgi:polysaccharide export outer membrane protein